VSLIRNFIALFLWLTGIVAIFVDLPGFDDVRLGALVIFISLAVISASRLTLFLTAVAIAGGALWLVQSADITPVLDGLRFALVFSIFLPALVLTRETIEASREIGQARNAFMELTSNQRATGVMIGSQLLGVVLTLGVMAMTAPLIRDDSPEPLRRDTILSVLRGLMLGGLWTPFSVGVIYITGFRPDLELLEICGPGFLMAMVGSLIAVLVGAGPRGVGQIGAALRIFRPLMPLIAVSILAVITFATLSPFSTIQSVALVMPILCALKLAMTGAYAARATLSKVASRIGATGNELLLFSAAVVLGSLLRESGLADTLVGVLALDKMPIELAIVVLMVLGPLFSFMGMHSILTGTLLFALLGPLDAQIPDMIEAQIVMFGWMCGAIVSFGSLSITLGTGLFRVNVGRIVLSVNLLFVALFATAATLIIVVWLWNSGAT